MALTLFGRSETSACGAVLEHVFNKDHVYSYVILSLGGGAAAVGSVCTGGRAGPEVWAREEGDLMND